MVSNLKSETARANGAKSRETGLFNAEILTQASPDLGSAFRKLADDSRSLALANRYESRLQRVYDRAYKTLRELQLARKSEPPAAAHQPGSTAPSVSEGRARNRIYPPGKNYQTNLPPLQSKKLAVSPIL
jgi:hypothetical protein